VKDTARSSTKRRARAQVGRRTGTYLLRLYVTGTTARSTRSILNVRSFCEERLLGCYRLEVIDIYQQPELARDEQIIAAPTLIKIRPLPLRTLVGDLSDRERLLEALDVRPAHEGNGE
jgi:circadian clock protein KaiB